jgi:transcriptional regulator with XRE-family HTH domain
MKMKKPRPSTISECLARNLRGLRAERGLTQGDLARRCRLSLSFVQLVEGGRKWVSPGTVTVLARALRVPEERLFRGCEPAPAPDSKQMLVMVGRAVALYAAIPDDLARLLAERCAQPGWSWPKFRKFLA